MSDSSDLRRIKRIVEEMESSLRRLNDRANVIEHALSCVIQVQVDHAALITDLFLAIEYIIGIIEPGVESRMEIKECLSRLNSTSRLSSTSASA